MLIQHFNVPKTGWKDAQEPMIKNFYKFITENKFESAVIQQKFKKKDAPK